MKTFIMKPMVLAMLLVCLMQNFTAVGIGKAELATCGTIIVEGDVMLTATIDPSADIELITLKGNGKTFVFTGCGSNSCTDNISGVPLGTYQATVVTSDCTYSETVVKR